MKWQALAAVTALALLALAGVGASADRYVYTGGAWIDVTQDLCPNAARAQAYTICPGGAGPAAQVCVPAQTTCAPCDSCNPDTAIKICGAFCSAGQQPAGWPYGWCSEYWLRPDSNF